MRISAFAFVAVLALTGCPKDKNPADGGDDAGYDGGNPHPMDACSGACGPTQICDGTHRICVDACGGCDAGVCTKTSATTFECVVPPVACNGATCAAGQIACIAGGCSCLKATPAEHDSCESQGMICDGTNCQPPQVLQQCKTTGAPCPQGSACQPVFGDPMDPNAQFLCTKDCGGVTMGTCDLGDLCSGVGCLPNGLFNGFACAQQVMDDGGMTVEITVPPGNVCLQRDGNGAFTESTPTGNCTYALFTFDDLGLYEFPTCRPPGQATDAGLPCKNDYRPSQAGTLCGTGLECALTTTASTGICLSMCNAAPPRFGFTPQPACAMGESCINLYRMESADNNAVLGVCMQSCNVFDPASTCAPVGTQPASCVPTDPLGAFVVSTDGSGVCVPQNTTVSALDATCSTSDPFKGAACNTNQVCATLDPTQAPTCHAVCDTDCSSPNPPARCGTEANASCPSGKACKRVTSTTGAILGFCE